MVEKRDDKGDQNGSPLVQLAHYSGHGLTIALSTGLFLLAGWWLDGKAGTRPLFAIAGALLGAAAGFYSLLQHLLFLPRQKEEDARKARQNEDDAGPETEPGNTDRTRAP